MSQNITQKRTQEQIDHVREKLDEIYTITEREVEWVLSNAYPLRAKIIKDKINQAVTESIQVLNDLEGKE